VWSFSRDEEGSERGEGKEVMGFAIRSAEIPELGGINSRWERQEVEAIDWLEHE